MLSPRNFLPAYFVNQNIDQRRTGPQNTEFLEANPELNFFAQALLWIYLNNLKEEAP